MSVASIYSGALWQMVGLTPPTGKAAPTETAPIAGVPAVGGCGCGAPDCPICGSATTAAGDQLVLSPAAEAELAAAPASGTAEPAATSETSIKDGQAAPKESTISSTSSSGGLTEEEQAEVEELKKTDREVRAHEQAHQAAAGAYANGGASFEYETGPDGNSYAVAGEVSIDVSEVSDDPEATIRKMQQVRSAALAPADPSAQDHAVAAQAMQLMQKAQQEARETDSESDEQAPRGVAREAEKDLTESRNAATPDKRFASLETAVSMLDLYA